MFLKMLTEWEPSETFGRMQQGYNVKNNIQTCTQSQERSLRNLFLYVGFILFPRQLFG